MPSAPPVSPRLPTTHRMKTHLLIALAVSGLFTGAQAGIVRLGVPADEISGPVNTSGFVVQYSINSNPGTFAYANDADTYDSNILAETTTVSGQTFRLELTNTANVGTTVSLQSLNAPSPFSLLSTSPLSPGTAFNGLSFLAIGGGSEFQLDFSNISFTTPDPQVTVTGSIAPASLGGTPWPIMQSTQSFLAYTNDDGSAGDLSAISWTFGADVTLTHTPGSGPPEPGFVGVTLNPASFSYTAPAAPAAVPETSTWVMGFLALGATVFLARRKTAVNR